MLENPNSQRNHWETLQIALSRKLKKIIFSPFPGRPRRALNFFHYVSCLHVTDPQKPAKTNSIMFTAVFKRAYVLSLYAAEPTFGLSFTNSSPPVKTSKHCRLN